MVIGAVNLSWRNDLNDRVRRDIVSQGDFEKAPIDRPGNPNIHS